MKYFAFTIGPIYKTMQLARKTREFWAASFLFSLLANKLCKELKLIGIKDEDFLVPHPQVFMREMKNVGLYFDRIIFKSSENIWDKLESFVIDRALSALSVDISRVTPGLKKEVLKSYFKIYIAFNEVEDGLPPLKQISLNLNALELFNYESSDSNTNNLIRHFLENVNTEYDDNNEISDKNNYLREYYDLPDYKGNIRIPSIVEITTKSLQGFLSKEKTSSIQQIFSKTLWRKNPDEKDLFKQLKNSFGEQVKNYNKYICILQADGDKLGNSLIRLNGKDVNNLSKDLIEWGEKDALRLIINYGALPIYIGGDDVLCFAPVNNGTRNVFDLALDLHNSYCDKTHIKSIGSTLSLSIKIAYYKSPMFESYFDTFTLLNDVAKKHEYNGVIANSCCINLEKHSGQPHEFVFNLNEEFVIYIRPIIDSMSKDEKKISFISSVFYKIRANEQLLEIVSGNKDRLWYFFENNFDEAKQEKESDTQEYKYLKAIHEYLFYLFRIHGSIKNNTQEMYRAISDLYSSLKIVRFIKGLDYDN